MIDNFLPTSAEYVRVLPEIILTLVATLIMFLEAVISDDKRKGIFAPLSILGLAAAMIGAVMAYGDPGPAFQNMLIVDGFATFFRILVIGVGLLAVLSSSGYLRRENSRGGEYYALILFSIVGQSIMASANELIMIFIGLEISSIASYILAGYLRDDARNNESALKYFLLGSFATAFLLYGVAWIYGTTGFTNLTEIHRVLARRERAGSAGGSGGGADLRRLRVQDFRRPVPILGSRRIPGSAGSGGRVSFHRSQGRRVRGSSARIHVGLRIHCVVLDAAGLGSGARHHDRGKFRRDPAIQHQAAAGLQLHRSCRLCAGGRYRELG